MQRDERSDRPDVGGDEDDDGEGAEPGVADGGLDVARHARAGEVAQRDDDHAQRQGQRYQVEHPHLAALRLGLAAAPRRPGGGGAAGEAEGSGRVGGGGGGGGGVRLAPEASRRRGCRVEAGSGAREIEVSFVSPENWRGRKKEGEEDGCWWARHAEQKSLSSE